MDESINLTILLVIIFSGFLLAMGVFFFVLFTKYHRNLELRQQEALSNLIIGQDNERYRLSRDLHDEIGIDLADIIITLDDIKTTDQSIIDVKKEVKEKVIKAQGDIRNISHDLAPLSITNFGLVSSIQDHIHRNKGNIKIDFTTNCDGKLFNEKTESHFYKIVKEFIFNSQKHSKASKIDISLNYNQESKLLVLHYMDNGIGLGADEKNISGIGMKNIKTRVELMKGNIKIEGSNGFNAIIEVTTS